MIVTRNKINGSITISDIYKGYWRYQTYYGYTVRQAKQLFREYLKGITE